MTPSEPGPAPALGSRGLDIWQAALLILVAAVLFWPGQTTVPPVDRDEARFAQATVQMLESGDFIDIRLQEGPRYLQPAGIYWLQATAVAGLSEVEARAIWAHRVPSFLAAIAAVLLTGWLGARLFGPRVGLLGGLLLASTVLLNVEARLAKIDAMLLASILLALVGLHRVYVVRQDRGVRLPWGWAVLFWVAVGAGILLKGPINPLVIGLTALTLSVIERRAGWLLALRPAWGVLIAAAIALPWYVAIYFESEGAFFQRSAGQNFLGKLFEGEQGHGFPPGYHVLVAPAVMWPAVLALVLAVPWIWRRRRDPAVRFCLAWALPVWVLYELVATKLPHYVLPAYPALLLLAAAALVTPIAGEQAGAGGRRWPAWLFGAGWAVWLVVGLGLAAGPLAIALIVDGEASIAAIAVALAALTAVGGLALALRRGPVARAVYAFPLVTLLAVSLNLHVTFPGIDAIWFNQEVPLVAEEYAPCPNYRIATAPLDLESVVFLTRTDTVIEDIASIESMLRAGRHCAVLFLEEPQATALRERLADAPVTLAETGRRVTGINFSNGRRVDLGVYVTE